MSSISKMVIFISVFFVFFIIYTSNPEYVSGIKITDWISAFCNVFMAGAAIGGFWIAKNWQRQKMHEDAYQLSKKIVLDNYRDIANLYSDLSLQLDFYSIFISSLPQRGKEHLPPIEKVHQLKNKLKSAYHLRSELEDNVLYIEKLGWKFKFELLSFDRDFNNIAFGTLHQQNKIALDTIELIKLGIDNDNQDDIIKGKGHYLDSIISIKHEQKLLDDKYEYFKNFSKQVNGYFDIE